MDGLLFSWARSANACSTSGTSLLAAAMQGASKGTILYGCLAGQIDVVNVSLWVKYYVLSHPSKLTTVMGSRSSGIFALNPRALP